METCPSCGESLNLVEDVGLRPADETEEDILERRSDPFEDRQADRP